MNCSIPKDWLEPFVDCYANDRVHEVFEEQEMLTKCQSFATLQSRLGILVFHLYTDMICTPADIKFKYYAISLN